MWRIIQDGNNRTFYSPLVLVPLDLPIFTVFILMVALVFTREETSVEI